MAEQNLKQKTKKGLYWSFFNQLSNQGIQFIIGIFMARMLSPSDYGITALPAVFMAVAGVFVGGGFGDALIRKPELKEEDLSTAFYYSIIVGIVCYILLFIASPWIADFYNTPVLEDLMRVTAISFLYSPLNTPQFVILQRKLDFKTPAKISIVCRILSGIIGISLAYTGYGVWALVLSGVISGVVGFLITWYAVKWYPKTGWSQDSFRYLWNYGNKIMAIGLMNSLYDNITPIFIGKYYSTADLGIYNRANGYSQMPARQIAYTVQHVSFPVISKIINDETKLKEIYRRMIRLSAFVVFPIMMLLAALAKPLVITMITEKWESCIYLLQILCFSIMWFPVQLINISLLKAKGRSDYFLKLEIWKKIFGVVFLVITLPLGLVVFCYGRIFSSFIMLAFNTYYTKKIINFGFVQQIKDVLPIFFLSVTTFIIVYSITIILSNYILQIIIGSILGFTFYIGIAKLLKFSELDDAIYMLNRK